MKSSKFCSALVALALIVSFNAFADVNSSSGANALSGSQSGVYAAPQQNLRFGDTNVDNEKIPVQTAIAPSSISQAPCQGWRSRAAQLVVFGGSGGESFTISWCVAAFLGEQDVAKQILCNTDNEYRKARKQAGKECKLEAEPQQTALPGH